VGLGSVGDSLARWAENVEQKKNPSRLRWLKNQSAKWLAHLAVALLIVAVWPLAIAWKGRIWVLLTKERDSHKAKFQNIAASVGVPFVESGEVTAVEQIYILDKISDAWTLDAPGFLDLVIEATDLLLLSRPNDVLYVAEEFLPLDGDELKSYCRKQEMSEQDEARVIRWASWSKSGEARMLEGFFRQKWFEQNKAA
jgi:hypothetical protein